MTTLTIDQDMLDLSYTTIMADTSDIAEDAAEWHEDELRGDINAMLTDAEVPCKVLSLTVCPQEDLDDNDDIPTVEQVLEHVYSQIQAGTQSYGWDGLWDVTLAYDAA